jgi:hypothetical protein
MEFALFGWPRDRIKAEQGLSELASLGWPIPVSLLKRLKKANSQKKEKKRSVHLNFLRIVSKIRENFDSLEPSAIF